MRVRLQVVCEFCSRNLKNGQILFCRTLMRCYEIVDKSQKVAMALESDAKNRA